MAQEIKFEYKMDSSESAVAEATRLNNYFASEQPVVVSVNVPPGRVTIDLTNIASTSQEAVRVNIIKFCTLYYLELGKRYATASKSSGLDGLRTMNENQEYTKTSLLNSLQSQTGLKVSATGDYANESVFWISNDYKSVTEAEKIEANYLYVSTSTGIKFTFQFAL